MKMRWRRRVFKSELCIGLQLLLDGGGHQQYRWSLPAAAVVILVVVGCVSWSASRPDAGGRERQWRNHKFYAIDKLNQSPEVGAIIVVRME